MAMLEAQAGRRAGRFPCATRRLACPDVVEHGKTGLLAPRPGDEKALSPAW